MVRTKIVRLSEVGESGTLCLSPLRQFEECHNCPNFLAKVSEIKRRIKEEDQVETAVEGALESMRCKPRVRPEAVELMKEKELLLKKLREVEMKLSKLS